MIKAQKDKRTKLTTKTYMKEAIDYQIVIIKGHEDYYITIKKYDNMSEPFRLKDKNDNYINYIENGSYVVEVTPLKENYNIRFYISKEKKLIDFYVDISLENGVKDKVPYYIDLYLDIVYYSKQNKIGFDDEDELLEALNTKKISKKDYNLAYKTGNALLEEIKNSKNKYFDIDCVSIINRYGL